MASCKSLARLGGEHIFAILGYFVVRLEVCWVFFQMNVGKELQCCFYGLKPTLIMEQEIVNDFLEYHFVPICGCYTLSFRISISSNEDRFMFSYLGVLLKVFLSLSENISLVSYRHDFKEVNVRRTLAWKGTKQNYFSQWEFNFPWRSLAVIILFHPHFDLKMPALM